MSTNLASRVRVVVALSRHSSVQLVGGPWSAAIDGGDPRLEDACLVRAAVRHFSAETGVDLSRARQWVRLCSTHFMRPQETVRGVHYDEQAEETVTFLCYDAHVAAVAEGSVGGSEANADGIGDASTINKRARSSEEAAGSDLQGRGKASLVLRLRARAPTRLRMLSLSGLLDYRETDKAERAFEAALAGEALWECLVRDAAAALAAAWGAARAGAGGDSALSHSAGKRERDSDLNANVREAARLFDPARAGFLLAGDIESILQNGGLFLSRLAVRTLVSRVLGDTNYQRKDRWAYAGT